MFKVLVYKTRWIENLHKHLNIQISLMIFYYYLNIFIPLKFTKILSLNNHIKIFGLPSFFTVLFLS